MKTLILAAALAVSSILAVPAASQAQNASVTIRTDNGPGFHRGPHYRPHQRQVIRTVGPRHRCFTKKVKTWRNGHMVVRTTRVCR